MNSRFSGPVSAPPRARTVSPARARARAIRTRLRIVPRAAWVCALVALANGLAWSLITPPFQVPDENAHYAYVQQLVQTGDLPHPATPAGALSPQQDATLSAIDFYWMVGRPYNPAPFTDLQQHAIEQVASEKLSARGTGDALTADNNPPLYYAIEAVPYMLMPGGGVLDRLALMRAVSALMGAITVLLVFMFLRELLPSRRWAWSAGALLVAFQPMFAFISGGVNNDNLLYLAATGILWALARAFRRGLDRGGGLLLGAFLGFGLVAKLNLLGFLPALALALLLLLRRSWASPDARREALRGAGAAVLLGAAPLVVYELLAHLLWNRGAVPIDVVTGRGAAVLHKFNFRGELSHIWELYFAPLGHMRDQFPHLLPIWDTWFRGLVGRFGWLDYEFPEWTSWTVLGVAGALVTLALGELARCRHALRRRIGELAVYAGLLAGLCVEIGIESYHTYIQTGGQFEQPRYLLPMIGLYAAIVALAVRFGGRRFGPALAAAVVVLAIGHDLYAQAITIARYYA